MVAFLALAVTAAACGGSAMAPAQVKAANEAVSGQSGGATVDSSGAAVPADGPGTGEAAVADGDTGGSTGSAGGDSTAATAGGGAPKATGANSATGTVKKASCDGFKNAAGITDKTITITNAADVSGPVPGLFSSAQQATKAYVAYFNATSDICGRKLVLKTEDSRTDAGADQQAYAKACESSFAAVGSMSAFDSGGAKTAEGCGLPDIRSSSVTHERNSCKTCFSAQVSNTSQFNNSVPDYFVQNEKASAAKAAFLYINAGAAAQNAETTMAVLRKRGMNIVYSAGIDVSEFNYGPYVQAMKQKGVRWVQWLGAYQQSVRLAKAMKSAGFHPDFFVQDSTAYNPEFVKSGGDAVEGTVVYLNFTPFEEAAANKETQLYLSWLNQTSPGAAPSMFGVFSWSASRLFVERAIALGGQLNRANLVNSMRGVRSWTANGMHAAQPVASKQVGGCMRFLQLRSGKWRPLGGTRYRCAGATTVG